MKDGALKSCVGMVCVVAMYGIYAFSNPGTDGVVFGTVAAIIGGLAGYGIGSSKAAKTS